MTRDKREAPCPRASDKPDEARGKQPSLRPYEPPRIVKHVKLEQVTFQGFSTGGVSAGGIPASG